MMDQQTQILPHPKAPLYLYVLQGGNEFMIIYGKATVHQPEMSKSTEEVC